MYVLCACVDGKGRVESLVPMREGRQPPELRPPSISALFGDAGWPQRYGYAVPYKTEPSLALVLRSGACVVLVDASMPVMMVDGWLTLNTRVMLTRTNTGA